MAEITLTPARACAGSSVNIKGTGFDPSAELVVTFTGVDFGGTTIPVELGDSVVGGDGNFSTSLLVPHMLAGPDGTYNVLALDGEGANALTTFDICCDGLADGVDTSQDPVLAEGGAPGTFMGLAEDVAVYAYIHHDGAHYVAWRDPSVNDSASTYPPPANHALNVTVVPDDGGAVITHELDTDYAWSFLTTSDFVCQCVSESFVVADPVWNTYFWFNDHWAKPIYDVKFASDGANLWLAVLTRETIPYPYLSSRDNVHCGLGPTECASDSQIAQFSPLSELTDGFTSFARRSGEAYFKTTHPAVGIPDDFWYDGIFPTSDPGETNSGHWKLLRAVMFSGGVGGFTRIGSMDAKFCPGVTDGTKEAGVGSRPGDTLTFQKSPLGSFFSGVSLAASEAEPGVCHMVWSEGGDWGMCGDSSAFDLGPGTRSYRVGYSTWDAAGKTAEVDLFSSSIDRGSFYFQYGVEHLGICNFGYSWPTQSELAASGIHAVRNDHGSPVLFIAWPNIVTNPDQLADGDGFPWLDRGHAFTEPTLEMYDISGGTPTLLQTLGGDMLPTPEEVTHFWPDFEAGPSNILYGGMLGYDEEPLDEFTASVGSGSTIDRAIAVSRLYEDPLDGGQQVYLLAVPWGELVSSTEPVLGSKNRMRCFYRVPCDGSAAFDWMDGVRQVEFTIMPDKTSVGTGLVWTSQDFYSDPHNVWVPHAEGLGLQYDRVCKNRWDFYTRVPSGPDQNALRAPEAWGSDYDTENDTISFVSFSADWPISLFDFVVEHICRECNACKCQPVGLHVWQVV